jgi:thiol-disulfide isomerase/thioredoxin
MVEETPTPEPAQAEEPPAETPAVEPEPVEVPEALTFTATTVDGQSFEGATLAGQDSVLYFWAPWCTVCRAEAPALPAIAGDFEGDATFYGVAGLSPDVAAMQGFVDDTGTQSLTHIADTDGTIYTGFGVSSQTTFAFINDDGTIEIVRGPLSPDEVRSKTQALIDS